MRTCVKDEKLCDTKDVVRIKWCKSFRINDYLLLFNLHFRLSIGARFTELTGDF